MTSTKTNTSRSSEQQTQIGAGKITVSSYTPLPRLEFKMANFVGIQGDSPTGLLILLRGLPGSGKSKLAK